MGRLLPAVACSVLLAPAAAGEAGQAPALISRDAAGSATLHAVQLAEPLRIDGKLDEALYTDVQPISDFVQIEPQEGSPATERTEIWLAFDEDNHKTTFGISSGRVNLVTRFSVEPTYSINRVELVQGAFSPHLAGARATWTPWPLMFTSAFLQYNSSSHALSANVRLRWEYRPGSELFVVYNEDRDTLTRRFPQVATRAFIVKINRLLRF
jgi:hypothetical protein